MLHAQCRPTRIELTIVFQLSVVDEVREENQQNSVTIRMAAKIRKLIEKRQTASAESLDISISEILPQ